MLSDLYEEIYDIVSTKVDNKTKQAQGEPELTMKSPTIDPITGEWLLNEWDVECISIGAGILGCGGGGSPYIGRIRAKNALKTGKKIRVIDASTYVQTTLIAVLFLEYYFLAVTFCL